MPQDFERRILQIGKVELRRAGADSKAATIRGYAAKFDTLSEPLYGFREQIAVGAFDGCLTDDVRALFNHDPNHILGRTASGTCRLSLDSTGLAYEVDLPDTQCARDLAIAIERGDVSQSSFAFRCAPNGDTWDENDDGVVIRTITKFARLYDVSPVTYPAYQDTTTGMRALVEEYRSGRAGDEAATARASAEQRRHAASRARLLRLVAA